MSDYVKINRANWDERAGRRRTAPAGRPPVHPRRAPDAVVARRPVRSARLRYPYFEQTEPLVFDDAGTYVQTDAVFVNTVTHSWNHGLGEIITGLLDAGLRLAGQAERLAASYTLQAVKD